MQKHLNTFSINFMKECYKFFGFGDNFINMLETVGKNHTASIILDDGTVEEGNLERVSNFEQKKGFLF